MTKHTTSTAEDVLGPYAEETHTPGAPEKTRVLLVGQPGFCCTLADAFPPSIEEVGRAHTPAEAIWLAQDLSPDVAFLPSGMLDIAPDLAPAAVVVVSLKPAAVDTEEPHSVRDARRDGRLLPVLLQLGTAMP